MSTNANGMRPTPWGTRPTDWPIRRWGEIAARAGEPITVDAARRYKQVTVRVRHQGVAQRLIDERRNHRILSPNQTAVRGGQFILSKIDARNGACGFIPDDLDGAIVTGDFPVYSLSNEVDHTFIDYTVAQEQFWYLCGLASEGTTNRVRLSPERFEELEFVLPPLSEQRKIAQILSSVDEAIERTEAVIERVQEVKRALAQGLLRRGMPGRHTRFKQTEVGEIPEDWEVVRLGDVARVDTGFTISPVRRPEVNARPYLRVANVQGGFVDLTEVKFLEATDKEFAEKTLAAGDLVMVEGHANISQLGRVAIVPPDAAGMTYQNHIFRLRPDIEKVNAAFLAEFINGPRGRDYFSWFGGTSSGLNTVSSANVRGMPIPLPERSEQMTIIGALSAVDQRLDGERARWRALATCKRDLAGALLTGQIRVANH